MAVLSVGMSSNAVLIVGGRARMSVAAVAAFLLASCASGSSADAPVETDVVPVEVADDSEVESVEDDVVAEVPSDEVSEDEAVPEVTVPDDGLSEADRYCRSAASLFDVAADAGRMGRAFGLVEAACSGSDVAEFDRVSQMVDALGACGVAEPIEPIEPVADVESDAADAEPVADAGPVEAEVVWTFDGCEAEIGALGEAIAASEMI